MPAKTTPAAAALKLPENPVVIAFDLSIKRTGWAVGDLDGARFGALSFTGNPKKNPALRFVEFRKWCADRLDKEQPNVVLYEESDPRRMPSGQAVNCAVGLRTVLEMECAIRAIPTRQLMPNSLKKAFTGSGKATKGDKTAMVAAAAARFDAYNPQNDSGGDIADSLALLWVWLNKPETFEPKPKPVRAKKEK